MGTVGVGFPTVGFLYSYIPFHPRRHIYYIYCILFLVCWRGPHLGLTCGGLWVQVRDVYLAGGCGVTARTGQHAHRQPRSGNRNIQFRLQWKWHDGALRGCVSCKALWFAAQSLRVYPLQDTQPLSYHAPKLPRPLVDTPPSYHYPGYHSLGYRALGYRAP